MRTSALFASSSAFRRLWYRDRLPRFGIDVVVAKCGLDCMERMHDLQPDIVILDTALLWGGCEGVLALRAEDPVLQEIPFVLVDSEGISPLTYRLAQYQLQSYLVHGPTIEELVTTIQLLRLGICVNGIEDEACVMS